MAGSPSLQGLQEAVRHADPTQSVMKTHLQEVQMVWVGGDLLYANKVILDKIKPGQCEPMMVYGSQKTVCVKNTKIQVLKDLQVPLEPSRLEPRRSKWWWCSPHEPSAPATLEDRR